MIRNTLARLAASAALVCTMLLGTGTASAQIPPKVLVLYDHPAGTQYEKLGYAYAIMLRNLLGHFNATVDLVPVESYVAGSMSSHDATFYLGAIWNNPLSDAFMNDAVATTRPLVWFKDNIWEIAWDTAKFPTFQADKGFSFLGLRGMNTDPTPASPSPGFFDTVQYKGLPFVKYYAYDPTTDSINADPDVGLTSITNAARATAPVMISNTATGEIAPYVVRAGNFWYVADMPFSYIGPRDRYLVIADLLHDMLGINHAESHLALVRLEDVGATVSVQTVRTLTDYLRTRAIPFGIATIPHYKDPNGTYNGGVAEDVPFASAGNLQTALNYALARGGEIWMHGYTHQYGNTPNPYSAVSGEDFEFWNIVLNAPIADETGPSWAAGRMDAGRQELIANPKYTPVGWEFPHYNASPTSSRVAAQKFSKTYQRAVYYTSDRPNFTALLSRDFAVGQFFPYVIQQDYYGQRVVPENLGNIEYLIPGDPASSIVYTADDILTNATYAKTVRDGFASFFFHPYLLEPELNVPGFADFTKLITGITGMGYTWARASRVQ